MTEGRPATAAADGPLVPRHRRSINPHRPLDQVTSIKLKLGVLVGASAVVAAVVAVIGDHAGVPVWLSLPVTISAALGVTMWLAHGMTAPLREMTDAAVRMAGGDYATDVTITSRDEVGVLAAAFTRMAGDLAAVDRHRRHLLTTVSHELRTPLAAQRALLENLVDGVSRPDPGILRTALSQAERLSSLVDDLLDLSRLEAGQTPLRLEPIRVADLMERAVSEARLQDRPVRYQVAVVPEDLEVQGDPARLAQVVANLLDNASRHSPTGGRVSVSAGRKGASSWFAEVADDGPGLSEDDAGRLSQPLGRQSTRAPHGGGGLGLAIASWVCRLHSGTIAVLPPGPEHHGARIRATLPVRPPVTDPPSPLPSQESERTMPLDETADAAEPSPPSATRVVSRPSPAPAAAAAPPARPPHTSLFGDFWPERDSRPQVIPVLASVAVGGLAAMVLPFRDLGLGLWLVLVTGGILVLASSPFRRRAWTLLTVALCTALGALVVVRADSTTALLAVAMAGLLVTTALTRARGFAEIVAGACAWVLSGARGLPLLGRTLTAMTRQRLLWPILRTVAWSGVLLVFFGGLFASADAVFGAWTRAILPTWQTDDAVFRGFVWFLTSGVVLAACYLAINPPAVERLRTARGRPVRGWEWQIPVVVVVLVMAGFIAAEGSGFFGSHEYLQQTTGLTYAEYVHRGFAQLTLATAATLLLVGVVAGKASRERQSDRLALRILLGVLCGLTLLVVASALYRMSLYQEAYGYTVLRVLVDGFEAWLGLLVVFVLVAGIRLDGRWVPRAALASAAVFTLVFGFANPAGWVADRNIERYQDTGRLDAWYLVSLGDDAVPTIAGSALPGQLRTCLVGTITRSTTPGDAWSWNYSRSRAQAVRDQLGADASRACMDVIEAAHDHGRRGPAPLTAPDRGR